MKKPEVLNLIKQSLEGVEWVSCSFKSNRIWALLKKDELYLQCFVLTQKERKGDWQWTSHLETDDLQEVDCPMKFLEQTKPVSEVWRKKAEEYNTTNRSRYHALKKDWRFCQYKRNKGKKIILETDSVEIPTLEMYSLSPLLGIKRGLYYKVQVRRIKSWKIV